jgi:WD40 repeat protein
VTVSGPAAGALLESWDPRSWQRENSLPLSYQTLLDYSTNFEPKSFTLPNTYVVLADGAFRLYNTARLADTPRIFHSGFQSNDWAGSPDGRMAAADSSGMIRVWDVEALKPVATLKSFRLGAHSVAFSPDGLRLAAGSNGREAVRFWDTETWQEVLTLGGIGSRISGLKFSPDGRHLLAINDAGLAHLWTAPTWEEIAAEETQRQP